MLLPGPHRLAAALLFLPIITGCAATRQPPTQTSTRPVSRYPHTEADVRFMSAMIGHHAQALIMADWASTHDAGPAVRRLADRILAGQKDEIRTM
jgi:uncharacterized protein (DUF305 family)